MSSVLAPDANGIYHWVKGEKKQLSLHFSTQEFACHCTYPDCQAQKLDGHFLMQLEGLRVALDCPIKVTSGYRCHAYQKALSGRGYETATISQHEKGNAADIQTSDFNKLKNLAPKFFKAIGTGSSTLHVDGRSDRPYRWTYDSGM